MDVDFQYSLRPQQDYLRPVQVYFWPFAHYLRRERSRVCNLSPHVRRTVASMVAANPQPKGPSLLLSVWKCSKAVSRAVMESLRHFENLWGFELGPDSTINTDNNLAVSTNIHPAAFLPQYVGPCSISWMASSRVGSSLLYFFCWKYIQQRLERISTKFRLGAEVLDILTRPFWPFLV